MLESAESILRAAIQDLTQRKLPIVDLADIVSKGAPTNMRREPYFIPNDPALATPESIINAFFDDTELIVENGFCIQASATLPTSFAKPYYANADGLGRCKDLPICLEYSDRYQWDYQLSFVGSQGAMVHDPSQEPFDARSTRSIFLQRLARELVGSGLENVSWIRTSPSRTSSWGFSAAEVSSLRSPEDKYLESIVNSKFVLCPRGNGNSSVRFFETLASCNIPVYIGNTETKFPLDWIIDWNRIAVRISCEEVLDGGYMSQLRALLKWSDREVNDRRRYIHRVYHQFLSPERIQVFEILVLAHCRALLNP